MSVGEGRAATREVPGPAPAEDPAPTKARDHRRNNIDGLRLSLAFLVLYSHSYPLGLGTESTEPLSRFSRAQATLGSVAVDFFFILSGYLITQSWDRSRGWASFLRKRFARIYPAFVVAAAVCIWVVAPLGGADRGAVYSWGAVVNNSWRVAQLRGDFQSAAGPLETFAGNPVRALNGSLWTIRYEFWCYVGVMLLGACALLRRRALVLALFVAAIGVHFLFEWKDLTNGGKILGTIFGYPRHWARFLPLYLSGVVAYLWRDRFAPRFGLALAALIGLAVACRVPHGLIFAMPTLGTYLVLYLSFTTDVRWHDAARYGDFSYGIYLYAYPIQQLIVHAFGRTVDPHLLFALAAPPTAAAGILSWYAVERRFLRMTHPRPADRPAGA